MRWHFSIKSIFVCDRIIANALANSVTNLNSNILKLYIESK